MHSRLYATTALLAAFALSGCDNPEPVAAKTCNCLPAPPPPQESQANVPEEHLARLHEPRYREHDEYEEHSYSTYEERSTEEQTVASSDYQSQSRSYDESESGATDEASAANVWVDGYGRSHYQLAASDQAQGGAVSVPPDNAERRDPWHAYDSKCGEKK